MGNIGDDTVNKWGGERLDYDSVLYGEFAHHIVRYKFCEKFAKGNITLDAACGVGYGSYYLRKFCNAKMVYGIDINEESIKEAKNLFGGDADNLIYKVSDVANTSFEDMQFDLIVSMETFEHVLNIDNYLKEMQRILKKDGKFIVSTPNKKFYSESGILNKYHLNEMHKDEFKICLSKYFDIDTLFYQLFPNDTLKNKKQPATPYFPRKTIKRLFPWAIHIKSFFDSIGYKYKTKKHGIKKNYGRDIERFIKEKKDVLHFYRIVKLENFTDIYNEKMGNFIAICSHKKK